MIIKTKPADSRYERGTTGGQVNLVDVAGFLNASISGQTDGEAYVAVINDLVGNLTYAYLIEVGNVTSIEDSIDAGDVSLIGVITEVSGAALTGADILA